jgi:lysyl-tRNA synthetase class 1
MSSSSGNTVGPIEALRLVPPEILRLLIANSKPNKAIEFDTGMGLVNLADEYERLSSRDFAEELSSDKLSRRQRVQIEDAQAALRLSMVSAGIQAEATSVSFRHLALLAQIKPNDDGIWSSLKESGAISGPSSVLSDRLTRMRAWIESKHFPEEMRIVILNQPDEEALSGLDDEQRKVIPHIAAEMESAEWTAEGITQAFKNAALHAEAPMRSMYRACYAMFMGSERGPRLAPILANCIREDVCMLAHACSTRLS